MSFANPISDHSNLMGVSAGPALSVLIVDDEPTLRESCGSVLTHEGYHVTLCGRGDEARELLQRRGFDIVMLDLHMSQVSGVELLQVCLEAKPDTLAIIMTGNPNVESSIEVLRIGAWDYLPKPFTASHLQILLGRATHTIVSSRAATVQEQRRETTF